MKPETIVHGDDQPSMENPLLQMHATHIPPIKVGIKSSTLRSHQHMGWFALPGRAGYVMLQLKLMPGLDRADFTWAELEVWQQDIVVSWEGYFMKRGQFIQMLQWWSHTRAWYKGERRLWWHSMLYRPYPDPDKMLPLEALAEKLENGG